MHFGLKRLYSWHHTSCIVSATTFGSPEGKKALLLGLGYFNIYFKKRKPAINLTKNQLNLKGILSNICGQKRNVSFPIQLAGVV